MTKRGREVKKTETIWFKEANKNLSASNKRDPFGRLIESLPVFTDGESCLSCWKVPVWKRIKFLFHGKIWVSVLSGKTQPPVWVECYKTAFEKEGEL